MRRRPECGGRAYARMCVCVCVCVCVSLCCVVVGECWRVRGSKSLRGTEHRLSFLSGLSAWQRLPWTLMRKGEAVCVCPRDRNTPGPEKPTLQVGLVEVDGKCVCDPSSEAQPNPSMRVWQAVLSGARLSGEDVCG